MKKKIVIILICLLLLVGCKSTKTKQKEKENSNNDNTNTEEVIDVKTDTDKWTQIDTSFSDSLNSKEIINNYSILTPNWENKRTEDHILFKDKDATLILLYKNEYYSDDIITTYDKVNSSITTLNSFDVEKEEGIVFYNNIQNNYISYYINNDDITVKLIGIAREDKIDELNNMLEKQIESLKNENDIN